MKREEKMEKEQTHEKGNDGLPVEIERLVRPGVIAKIKPLDECCFRLSIEDNGEEIQSGVWCPQSHVLAIEGEIAGFAETKEEVLEKLTPVKVEHWGLA